MLQNKVGARSLSPSLWPFRLNVLLISANRLFICSLRFNSPVFIPLTLSWQACACVSQDWANGSMSACELGVCQGDLHFEDGANPFSMVRTRRQLPRSILPVLSSTLPIDGDFRTKRAAGQGWEHQPGAQETWLQSSALPQPPKVTLGKSLRLHLHGRQSRLLHANTQPVHEAGLQPSSSAGGQARSGELLGGHSWKGINA